MKLIIDTDPGVDDAHALMAALAYPGAEVGAITTVMGNVPLTSTTQNACRILDAMDMDVPVYAGCACALLQTASWATEFHGADGLGDADVPTSGRRVEPDHAVHAILRMVNQQPGEWTLLAIGPLTNLALATRLDPAFPEKVAQLVVMGGAIRGLGNKTPSAEFNIYADPEAAAIVLGSWPKLTLVSWETTVDHPFTPTQVDQLLSLGTPRAEFLSGISQTVLGFSERLTGQRWLYEPDLLAAAVALEPSVVLRSETHFVEVELAGSATRGQTTVDWYDRTGQEPNVELVLEVDTQRVFEMLWAALK
jgi:purine nucleosidase